MVHPAVCTLLHPEVHPKTEVHLCADRPLRTMEEGKPLRRQASQDREKRVNLCADRPLRTVKRVLKPLRRQASQDRENRESFCADRPPRTVRIVWKPLRRQASQDREIGRNLCAETLPESLDCVINVDISPVLIVSDSFMQPGIPIFQT